MSITPQQLETDDTGSVTSLEIIGKSVCPSCKKQHEHLEYICTSEIYQGIIYIYIYAFSRRFYLKRLIVYSGYNFFGQYVCSLGIEPTTFVVSPLTSEEDTEATSRVLPGDDMPYNAPYERIKPSSKVKNYVCLCVCVRFLITSLT